MEEINHEEYFCKDITDPKNIEEILDNLIKKGKNEQYLNKLIVYYPILTPKICKKYHIQKLKTEKETLFNIIQDLVNKFGAKVKNWKTVFNKDEIEEVYNYIDDIIKNPAKEELKYLNIKYIPSRWDIIYNKIIKIDKEENDELIYYNLTNDLLQNIRNNKNPYQIISFLSEFLKLYQEFHFKNNIGNITKKFILLGLTNCEYIDNKNQLNFLSIFKFILNLKDNLQVSDMYIKEQILNPNRIFNGKLHKSILKFAKSKLAKSSFKAIFNMEEIPIELENEIFNDNIEKYICYFPYSSLNDTERTLKRFSLILINCTKSKKIINIENPILDNLLDEFSNIVVRKFTFGHEHQHLSGGLLFLSEIIPRLGTPPYKMENEKIVYDYNSDKKGERGELFEIKSYGKVFQIYNIYDLLFMANENYDNLDVNSHLEEFKNIVKKRKI